MRDHWDERTDLTPAERAQMRALEAREKGEVRTETEELLDAMKAGKARCSSCKRSIIWVRTAPAPGRQPKRMPVDIARAETVGPSQFDLKVIDGELRAIYISAFEQGYRRDRGEPGGYVSHFATCPNADQHRRRRGGA